MAGILLVPLILITVLIGLFIFILPIVFRQLLPSYLILNRWVRLYTLVDLTCFLDGIEVVLVDLGYGTEPGVNHFDDLKRYYIGDEFAEGRTTPLYRKVQVLESG